MQIQRKVTANPQTNLTDLGRESVSVDTRESLVMELIVN